MTDRAKAMDNLIAQDADLIDKLRDEDSYYRLQEKHWCIDAEELERQRLAAADLIETQAREIERLREALEVIRDGDYPYKQASQYAHEALRMKQWLTLKS